MTSYISVKRIGACLLVCIAVALISWGTTGHQTVAMIAERHLTPKAKLAVKFLLEDESLSDVSTWADEIKSDPQYRNTASLHYLDLPQSAFNAPHTLSYEQFVHVLKDLGDNNVYAALFRYEKILQSDSSSERQKVIALKFIVHLVGDIHQPMHVGSAEDKGGNTIQVKFFGKGTNLHALWDSKLIEHQQLTATGMVNAYDTVSANQIQIWQKSDPAQWAYESYLLSNNIYSVTRPGAQLSDDYYGKFIPIVQQRIEMAGIRLAGELNKIFEHKIKLIKVVLAPPPPDHVPVPRPPSINLQDVRHAIGQMVSIKGKIYGYKKLASMTLVDLGAAYPNQQLTIVFKGEAKEYFDDFPIDGKSLYVEGTVSMYKGKPEIVVADRNAFGVF